jgi:hypothetical protein
MKLRPIGDRTLALRVPREFAALMDALQVKDANTEALLLLETEEWQKLLDFCDLAHLTLPLAGVDQTGFPDWVSHRLETNLADNARRFELLQAVYMEAEVALRHAGVTHIVVKGFTQSPAYVADPRLRMQSDLDLFCPQNEIDAARVALMRIGYALSDAQDYSRADHMPTLTRTGAWQWRGNMFDPEMPPSIELHFCLWNDRVSLIELPEVKLFWDRRVPRKHGGMEFCGLSDVDQLGYFALHIVRGVICGDWVVHHVNELATFLQANVANVEFWNHSLATHSVRLRTLEAIAFGLARKWFSCTCSPIVCTVIERLPNLQKKWLDRFSGAPLEVMFRRNKDGHLLHVLLTDTREARRIAVRRALIPARIVGPGAAAAIIRYRRSTGPHRTNRYVHYLEFVLKKLFEIASANTALLFHGSILWLSG